MKALVINKPGELQVKDLSTPAIAADEVLVRMRAVGICHSDYELYSGKYIIPIAYPVTPGHVGQLVQPLGARLEELRIGPIDTEAEMVDLVANGRAKSRRDRHGRRT
jgi:L-iditol 2-dehydrogenase